MFEIDDDELSDLGKITEEEEEQKKVVTRQKRGRSATNAKAKNAEKQRFKPKPKAKASQKKDDEDEIEDSSQEEKQKKVKDKKRKKEEADNEKKTELEKEEEKEEETNDLAVVEYDKKRKREENDEDEDGNKKAKEWAIMSEKDRKQYEQALEFIRKGAADMWVPFINGLGQGKWAFQLFTSISVKNIILTTTEVDAKDEKGRKIKKIYANVVTKADNGREYNVTKYTVPLYATMCFGGGFGTYGQEHSQTYLASKYLFKLTDIVTPEMEEACGKKWKVAVDKYFDHMEAIQEKVLDLLFDHPELCVKATEDHMKNATASIDSMRDSGHLQCEKDSPEYEELIRTNALNSFKTGAKRFIREKDGHRVMSVRRSICRKMNDKQKETAKQNIEKKRKKYEAKYGKDDDVMDKYYEKHPDKITEKEWAILQPLLIANSKFVVFPQPKDINHQIVTRQSVFMARVRVQVFGKDDTTYGCALELNNGAGTKPEILLYRKGIVVESVSEVPEFKGAQETTVDYEFDEVDETDKTASNDFMKKFSTMRNNVKQIEN